MLTWIHSHDMSQLQLGTYRPLAVSCPMLWKDDRLTGQERGVGFVLVFRNFVHEDMPWTTTHFCMVLWHSCLRMTLVCVSTGNIRQMVFELDRTEIFRTDSS